MRDFVRRERRASEFDIRVRLNEFGYDRGECERIAQIIDQEYNCYSWDSDAKGPNIFNRLAYLIMFIPIIGLVLPINWLCTGVWGLDADKPVWKFILKMIGEEK